MNIGYSDYTNQSEYLRLSMSNDDSVDLLCYNSHFEIYRSYYPHYGCPLPFPWGLTFSDQTIPTGVEVDGLR